MENKLSEVMQSTMSSIKNMVEINNIVGEPITTPDGIMLVPVSKLSFGFGGGGGDFPSKGDKQGFGAGSAAGVKLEPVGFLVIKEGSVRMVNITPPSDSGLDKVLDLVPQVLDRVDMLINKPKIQE